MVCPALRGAAPSVVFDRHVDAAVDEELHSFVVIVGDQFVQDACRLVRTPSRIDVSTMLEKEIGHVQMTSEHGPGKRCVENLLFRWLAPLVSIHVLFIGFHSVLKATLPALVS